MEKQLNKFSRQYDIDWIRIFLIFSVFLFHIGMVFNGWGWHIKNDQPQEWLHPIMGFLHQWRMPLLFLVSGVGTRYALGKRTIGGFIIERHKRLFIPLIIGMFILVPVQVYIEKIDQYPTLLNFYLHLFEGTYPEGNMSWHHLWFILYLFLISIFFVPFIAFYRSKYYAKFENALVKFCNMPGSIIWFVIPIILSQYWLIPYFPEETHALVDDWAYIALDFLYFFYGFMLVGSAKIMESIVRDRYTTLGIAILSTYMMYNGSLLFPNINGGTIYYYSSLVMSWSLGLSILGFSRKYFNREHRWRKPLNQAIYPIYLLHQPIIIVIAYFVVSISIPIWTKALIILFGSVFCVWFIYQFFILPFNVARVVFGMKPLPKSEQPKIRLAYLFSKKQDQV